MNQEIVDQSAHFLVAGILVILVAPMLWWQGLVLGLCCGLIREVTEGGNVLSRGSQLDLFFWMMGGLCGALTGWAIA